jgi:hypothetical protein
MNLKWEYLISDEFEIRKVIAAHYLKDCDTIIDVGAYKKKIAITHNATIHTIDPLKTISGAFHGTFSEWLDSSPYIHGRIGIALLGFDFESNTKETENLFSFIKKCDTIILECAVLYKESIVQVQQVIDYIYNDFDILSKIYLDLPKIESAGFPVYSERVMYNIKRKKV